MTQLAPAGQWTTQSALPGQSSVQSPAQKRAQTPLAPQVTRAPAPTWAVQPAPGQSMEQASGQVRSHLLWPSQPSAQGLSQVDAQVDPPWQVQVALAASQAQAPVQV
jgi:hypothetical protein